MKRLRFILIAFAIFVISVLVFCLVQHKEPSYQGRKLSEWIKGYNDTGWNFDRYDNVETSTPAAAHAVRQIGTNAIPTLLRWLQVKDSRVKHKLNSLLDRQTLTHFRFQEPVGFWVMADVGFRILGEDALPAVPTLVLLMDCPDTTQRHFIFRCLCCVDAARRDMLPTIVPFLHDSDKQIQLWTASYLHNNYPQEAEKAGVYKLFPQLKGGPIIMPGANLPATNR